MKAFRIALSAVLLSLATAAHAQSSAPQATAPVSAVQQSFDQLKTLAGNWEGSLDGKPMHVSVRSTSMGTTLMHEMKGEGSPDNPITMLNVDGSRLLMTHYCDAGNQPRLVGTASPDGKTFTFDFVSATNLLPSQMGHMQHVVFTIIDANHHTELWQFALANGKSMGGLLDLTRTN